MGCGHSDISADDERLFKTAVATSSTKVSGDHFQDSACPEVDGRTRAYTVRVQWGQRDSEASAETWTGLVVQYSCGRAPLYTSNEWWVLTMAPFRGEALGADSVAVDFFHWLHSAVEPVQVEGDLASCSIVPIPLVEKKAKFVMVRLRMTTEEQAGIQSHLPHALPPFCVRHAVTGPLRAGSNDFYGGKRVAVTFPAGCRQRACVLKDDQVRGPERVTEWGLLVADKVGMMPGCGGGPVTCHFEPRTVDLRLPEEPEALPTPLHGDCPFPVDCARPEAPSRVHFAFAVVGGHPTRLRYQAAFVYRYLRTAVLQGDALAIRAAAAEPAAEPAAAEAAPAVWWTLSVVGRTVVAWDRVPGCVGLLRDGNPAWSTLVFREEEAAAAARRLLECAGFRTCAWLPVAAALLQEVAAGMWMHTATHVPLSTVPPHVFGGRQVEPSELHLLRWTFPEYGDVRDHRREVEAFMHTMPGFVKPTYKFGIVPVSVGGCVFESKVAAEFAYVASLDHPVLAEQTWKPIKCPHAPPPCIKRRAGDTLDDAEDVEDVNDSEMAAGAGAGGGKSVEEDEQHLPEGAPTELSTCFVLTVCPKGQVAWHAVPGCMGLQTIDPKDGPFAVNTDTLVFVTTREGDAARELLCTAGFRCMALVPSGNVCRTDTRRPVWTYKEPRAPRSTVPPHMAVYVPEAPGPDDQYWFAITMDGVLLEGVPRDMVREWVDAAQLLPGFVKVVRGGDGDFLCDSMMGFVFDSDRAAERGYFFFAHTCGMARYARHVTRFHHRRALCV